jgi:hypothetical protein
VIEMLIVAEVRMARERRGSLVDVDGVGQTGRPRLQLLDFRSAEYRALHLGNEFREGAYVDSNGVPPCGQSLDERGPAPDVGIQAEIAGPREGLDRGTDKCGTKTGWILVEPMREAAHRLSVARACDKRHLGGL